MPVDTQQVTIQFLSRHQKASESPIDYLHSLQQVAVQALPRLDTMGREELIRPRFVEGLLPGPLKEHFLRNPPTDTSDVKRTTLRFLATDKLVNLSNAQSSSVTTVERATKSSGLDSCQTTMAVSDLPGRSAIRRQSNSRWNKQPAWGNYNGHQADCIYCKSFGRNARRCGHNRPRKPAPPSPVVTRVISSHWKLGRPKATTHTMLTEHFTPLREHGMDAISRLF
ncbi:unnamed protein product [Schistosoma margrebowiei]|uniref:Uncharacterized protein n=1 Tax=Schistosoma margrebowiei TaxID=48269 RepID=A0A183MKU7_9TREM|nr:unnamed protein product [Schistosoma margrebowiei]